MLVTLPAVALGAPSGPRAALKTAEWLALGEAQIHPIAVHRAPAVPTGGRIEPDAHGKYTTIGHINGVAVRFLVDTEAALVTLNAAQARRLGLDFRRAGTRVLVSTAAGHTTAYRLRLGRIRAAGIQLSGVPAMVIEGAEPTTALLGMSFLGRLRLRHEGRSLILAPIR